MNLIAIALLGVVLPIWLSVGVEALRNGNDSSGDSGIMDWSSTSGTTTHNSDPRNNGDLYSEAAIREETQRRAKGFFGDDKNESVKLGENTLSDSVDVDMKSAESENVVPKDKPSTEDVHEHAEVTEPKINPKHKPLLDAHSHHDHASTAHEIEEDEYDMEHGMHDAKTIVLRPEMKSNQIPNEIHEYWRRIVAGEKVAHDAISKSIAKLPTDVEEKSAREAALDAMNHLWNELDMPAIGHLNDVSVDYLLDRMMQYYMHGILFNADSAKVHALFDHVSKHNGSERLNKHFGRLIKFLEEIELNNPCEMPSSLKQWRTNNSAWTQTEEHHHYVENKHRFSWTDGNLNALMTIQVLSKDGFPEHSSIVDAHKMAQYRTKPRVEGIITAFMKSWVNQPSASSTLCQIRFMEVCKKEEKYFGNFKLTPADIPAAMKIYQLIKAPLGGASERLKTVLNYLSADQFNEYMQTEIGHVDKNMNFFMFAGFWNDGKRIFESYKNTHSNFKFNHETVSKMTKMIETIKATQDYDTISKYNDEFITSPFGIALHGTNKPPAHLQVPKKPAPKHFSSWHEDTSEIITPKRLLSWDEEHEEDSSSTYNDEEFQAMLRELSNEEFGVYDDHFMHETSDPTQVWDELKNGETRRINQEIEETILKSEKQLREFRINPLGTWNPTNGNDSTNISKISRMCLQKNQIDDKSTITAASAMKLMEIQDSLHAKTHIEDDHSVPEDPFPADIVNEINKAIPTLSASEFSKSLAGLLKVLFQKRAFYFNYLAKIAATRYDLYKAKHSDYKPDAECKKLIADYDEGMSDNKQKFYIGHYTSFNGTHLAIDALHPKKPSSGEQKGVLVTRSVNA